MGESREQWGASMLIVRGASLLAAAWAAVVLLPSSANAAVTINIVQSGTDVVATVNGNITAGTEVSDFGSLWGRVVPDTAGIEFAPALPSYWTGTLTDFDVAGPSAFGSGMETDATSSSGDFLYLAGGSTIVLPGHYILGSPIAGTDTFAGQTIASLGLTPGTYVYGIAGPLGARSDTLTVVVGADVTGAVPEPAAWAMMLLGFGAIGFSMRRRKGAIQQLA